MVLSNFIISYEPFMSHTFTKLWIHAVFSTKNRAAFIHDPVADVIYSYLHQELELLKCPVKIINGTVDHVHLLFRLSPRLALADVIKQIKGSSAHWINGENIIPERFAWQTGYAGFAVSESVLEKTYQYIRNQKEYHLIKTFNDELSDFLELYGLTESDDALNG